MNARCQMASEPATPTLLCRNRVRYESPTISNVPTHCGHAKYRVGMVVGHLCWVDFELCVPPTVKVWPWFHHLAKKTKRFSKILISCICPCRTKQTLAHLSQSTQPRQPTISPTQYRGVVEMTENSRGVPWVCMPGLPFCSEEKVGVD